jgi:hypothetical protein
MKVKVLSFALALGILSSVGAFAMHMLALYAGYGMAWFELLSDMIPYYNLTLGGAFYVLVGAFFDGFIGGALLAGLYNWIGFGCCCGSCEKKK